jgi:serine/threonine protein kinase
MFTEEEVFQLVDGCIKGLGYLQENGISHGSIRLSNIYVTPSGTFKVADPALFNYSFDYEKICSDYDRYGKFVFLSPELMHVITKF